MHLCLAVAFPGQALYIANHCTHVVGVVEEGGELQLSKKIASELLVQNTVLQFALATD